MSIRNFKSPSSVIYGIGIPNSMSYVIFFCALIISYSIFVVPTFSYSGFSLTISVIPILKAFALFLFTLYILPAYEIDISTFSLHILFIFTIIPLIIYSTIGQGYDIYAYASVSCFIITSLLSQHQFHFPRFEFVYQGNVIVLLVSVFSIVLPLWLILQNGVPHLTALDLNQVYSVRGTTSYGGVFFVYLVTWLAKVFNPFLLAYSLSNRKILTGLLSIISQITVYLFTAHKIYLFSVIFVSVIAILLKYGKLTSGLTNILTLSLISSYIVYLLSGILLAPSIIIRRVFFLPAKIQSHYYNFFTNHSFALFSRTRIGFLIDEVYSQPLPIIIGSEYVSGASANTAYLADGYAQMGFLGLIIVSVILGVLLSIFNSITIVSDPVSLSPIIIPVFSLTNSALTTTLLTHGLIIGLILCLLYSPDANGPQRSIG